MPAQAIERRNGSANTSRPQREAATVSPENATVRPAVAIVRSIAAGSSWPAARSSRKRLITSSE
jgi:hypothetical protein